MKAPMKVTTLAIACVILVTAAPVFAQSHSDNGVGVGAKIGLIFANTDAIASNTNTGFIGGLWFIAHQSMHSPLRGCNKNDAYEGDRRSNPGELRFPGKIFGPPTSKSRCLRTIKEISAGRKKTPTTCA